MKRSKIGLLLIILPLFDACKMPSRKYLDTQNKVMEECRNNWSYDFLKEEKEIRVLLFTKGIGFCASRSSNFVIGVTSDSDTIGISDIKFNESIERNEFIFVSPSDTASRMLHLLSPPMFTIYKNKKDNKTHCSVKKVYYAQIRKK